MPEQTALITGGAGGMGLATAKILGRDHRIVISDISFERLDAAIAELGSAGVSAEAVVCDITDRASVDALFVEANSTGDLRAVVHTAGVSPQMGSADFIVRVNALGTIHVTEAALALATKGFAIVNVASIAGHMLPRPLIPRRAYSLALSDHAAFLAKLSARANRGPEKMGPGLAYSLSKNFVIWYSAHQAAVFGAHGARILSVSPGSFDTEMGRLEEKSGSDKLLAFAALKRYGDVQEVAELLAFCASDKPGYLTGTDILVDGGTKVGLGGIKGQIALVRGK